VLDTSKDAFLNKLYVLEGFRRKFQNPENIGAKKNCFLTDLTALIDLQLSVYVHCHFGVCQKKRSSPCLSNGPGLGSLRASYGFLKTHALENPAYRSKTQLEQHFLASNSTYKYRKDLMSEPFESAE